MTAIEKIAFEKLKDQIDKCYEGIIRSRGEREGKDTVQVNTKYVQAQFRDIESTVQAILNQTV